MILFPDLLFFLFFPVYLLSVLVVFFFPGDLFLRKLSLTFPQRAVLALTIGISLWALLGLIFGYAQLRVLSYAYLLVTTIVWVITYKDGFKKWAVSLHLPQIDKLSLLIVLLGGALQIAAVWLIGFRQADGVLFCCRSVPDSIYHLALTQELSLNFPPTEPGSAGIAVKKYHYLANLVLADQIRVFHLPLIPTVYQYSSLFLIFFIGLSAVAITQFLKLSKVFQGWFLFFLFFAGDMLYALVFLRTGKLDLSYTIIDDASKLLTGPPRSFSIALFLGLITLILLWIREKKLIYGIFLAIVAGLLLEFKVYTGIVVFSGLGAVTLWRLLKKDFHFALFFILALIIALLTYIPVNNGAGGLVFSGLWRFENFMSQPQFNFQTLELTRLTYLAEKNYLRVGLIEAFYIGTYLIMMLGVTLLALFQSKTSLKKLPFEVTLFVGAVLVSSLGLGLFFIQSVGGANTIQFIIHYLTLSALFVALTLETQLKRVPKWLAVGFVIIIIVFTAGRSISEGTANFLAFKDREKYFVSNDNLAASNFLSAHTPTHSLVLIGDSTAFSATTMSLFFFGNRPLYLAGTSDHGVAGLEDRIKINRAFIESNNCDEAKRLLNESKATLVYRSNERVLPCEANLPLTLLFSNEAQSVFDVRP